MPFKPMGKLTYATALVVIPPPEVWPPIQAIRQQHDSKAHRWMPHLTLVYPFHPVADFPRLYASLAAAIASIPRFTVTLTEFKTFRHRRDNYTMWLKPEPKEPWLELHGTLLRASLRDSRPSEAVRFQPHLSVGQVQGKRQMEQLVADLQAAWRLIDFRVDHVSLIWRAEPPDDVFREADTIPLPPDRPDRQGQAGGLP